jgi:radical SAM superfamily enzyme YgiQ (UPF0313 family)
MIPAKEILIRPPVEAYSVLIPVTGGCSWNHCRFCGVYKGIQNYEIRPINEVLKDIEIAASWYRDSPYVYLAGGNPTSAPTEYLCKVLQTIKEKFPFVKRISSYTKVLDIIRKSDEELKRLAEAGLTIAYVGMESGSDIVLRYMKKGTTAKSLISAATRLLQAGIQVSLYIILGLGGKKWTEIHADETAKVLNTIKPTYFRFRTLNVMENSPLRADIESGEFEILSPLEIMLEMRRIIANLQTSLTSKMRNDHISNYVNIESDNIGQEKTAILDALDQYINDPRVAAWKHKNLKQM